MRTPVEIRSVDKSIYQNFCKNNPEINISLDEWRNIIYTFNESFREYLLETGDAGRLPSGFGEFRVVKKKRKRVKTAPDGRQFINLPVDWKKSKEKGKIVYNFNFDTEGYFFGWKWLKETTRLKLSDFWYFKPSRNTSRLITHYLKADPKYQFLYEERLKY